MIEWESKKTKLFIRLLSTAGREEKKRSILFNAQRGIKKRTFLNGSQNKLDECSSQLLFFFSFFPHAYLPGILRNTKCFCSLKIETFLYVATSVAGF